MFTGIVELAGVVGGHELRGEDLKLRIEVSASFLADVGPGDSIAVNGVCLTAVAIECDAFNADVSAETLQHTLLSELRIGSPVNLEKALTPTSRLGGHLVSGHVDGVGTVRSVREDGRSIRLQVVAPDDLARYLARKGSICVDGTSLTINDVQGAEFGVNIVPHTLSHTVIQYYRPGSHVHLEVDLIARYLERLLLGQQAADPSAASLTLQQLGDAGFLPASAADRR